MPRPKLNQPAYGYHISGKARVQIDGKTIYLGEHGSPESYARYYAVLAEYNANGQRLPADINTHLDAAPITVRCVTGAYRQQIEKQYAENYTERKRFEGLCAILEDEYGDVPADQFGPVKLAELRELFIASGNCRTYVNRLIRCVKKIFKHAISRELIDVAILQRLDTLEVLNRGQTSAPESRRVTTVDLAIVRATAEHLSPTLKAMVALQAATGMRPSEVCSLRPCDIEMWEDGVWLYRPYKHKTQHCGKHRIIPIIKDICITLGPFLSRAPEAYCFSPQESMKWFRDRQRANRKSKVPPSQRDRKKPNPKRQPGTKYKPCSYYRAIRSAAKKAKVDHWFPYQLRHTAATIISDSLGLEKAKAFLGHSHISMTEHYAQLTEANAIEAAKAANLITKC